MAFAVLSLVLLALGLSGTADADPCASGSKQIGGNSYCNAVEAIRYTNVGTSGSYDRVIEMKPDGTCITEAYPFSGPLSPLNEEVNIASYWLCNPLLLIVPQKVSLHFRGPIRLKQFAVYTPAPSNLHDRSSNHHRHGLNRRHGHSIHKTKETHDIVKATIEGQVVQWENNWFGGMYP